MALTDAQYERIAPLLLNAAVVAEADAAACEREVRRSAREQPHVSSHTRTDLVALVVTSSSGMAVRRAGWRGGGAWPVSEGGYISDQHHASGADAGHPRAAGWWRLQNICTLPGRCRSDRGGRASCARAASPLSSRPTSCTGTARARTPLHRQSVAVSVVERNSLEGVHACRCLSRHESGSDRAI